MQAQLPLPQPLIVGEVLFDCFSDKTQVLGGAPFNVAWNLQGLGLAPLFISRIGVDKQGQQVLAAMDGWGMDCRGIQQDAAHSTGRVEVALQQGQPSFNIVPDQAYDFINPDPVLELMPSITPPLLYRGTLAARSPVSRKALETLSKTCNAPVFLDLNLRPPWWRRDVIEQAMQAARWVKLSDAELFTLLEHEPASQEDMIGLAQSLCHNYQLAWLLVTLGEKGAFLVTEGSDVYWAEPSPVEVVDTVGAGDAFSAIMILALLKNWQLSQALKRGVAFASAVCGLRGAVTHDPAFYANFVANWQES